MLGVEAAEGTDAMLARCASAWRGRDAGGVLVKLVKPGQDRRADLPTIGPDTLARARPRPGCAGLRSRRAAPFWPTARPPSRRRTRRGCFCWACDPDDIVERGETT